MDVTELLEATAFNADTQPHIQVDGALCHGCGDHPCLRFCPAGCFSPNKEGSIDYYYVGCLECGTCLILCDQDAVKWNYPRGGRGVSFRY